MRYDVSFSELVGLTLVEAGIGSSSDRWNNGESIFFKTDTGRTFKLYHSQDCCESVSIEDVNGNWNDLIGSPILLAEESTSDDFQSGEGRDDAYLWTFYRLATNKGSVDIRWYGESNGYYGVSVDFAEC